jgi:hypothetical protein
LLVKSATLKKPRGAKIIAAVQIAGDCATQRYWLRDGLKALGRFCGYNSDLRNGTRLLFRYSTRDKQAIVWLADKLVARIA